MDAERIREKARELGAMTIESSHPMLRDHTTAYFTSGVFAAWFEQWAMRMGQHTSRRMVGPLTAITIEDWQTAEQQARIASGKAPAIG